MGEKQWWRARLSSHHPWVYLEVVYGAQPRQCCLVVLNLLRMSQRTQHEQVDDPPGDLRPCGVRGGIPVYYSPSRWST
jgi:hypothetical protein